MDKPREFWISMCTFNDGYTEIYECRDAEFDPTPPAEKVHVIEKSAYDQLKKENAELQAEVEWLRESQEILKRDKDVLNEKIEAYSDFYNEAFKQNQTLRELLREASEALEFTVHCTEQIGWIKNGPLDIDNPMFLGTLTREGDQKVHEQYLSAKQTLTKLRKSGLLGDE